ncbi:hypothetical protein SAMN04487850_0277 [Prevotella aff. ruminicola Tc2-24]|jgi:hypothetical protein|uniref:Uncharacterized protein n=1 Tax=Prevotella aff. ruminicola Tc2-24 TaxID=81582 RepID=A0A1I0M4A7_9BACT|nr:MULTISPECIES: hypothetical protein [Prevotella]SEE03506.1 hypothetical protein SAMN04487828_0270 [Prevotella sp. lc2012]SEV82794.1 hypothetical protein SAMN04487850_0277 [Prevotella aff. ruminicola Tc2-24]
MARTKQTLQESNSTLSIKSITKSSVWDIQENDVFRMWDAAAKDTEVKENIHHYLDIFKSAFLVEEIKEDVLLVKKSYEKRGFKVAQIKFDENMKFAWAIKKRPIMRVTDLTYENIRHISATKLLEVIDRNFGGGWDSLSQSIQDIILSGFDISTTTLPKDRLHKKGGMYEKKVADGYDVLEVEKGGWVEAIFAKLKPEQEKIRMQFSSKGRGDEDLDDDEDYEVEDNYSSHDEDDSVVEDPKDEDITEDNYSTMMDLGGEDPDDEAAGMIDFSDE